MHVIFLYADTDNEWNCSEWRCLLPANAINAEHAAGRTPHTAQLFYLPTAIDWNSPAVQAKLGLGDVLIFQRNVIIPEVWASMDYWRALGKIVLVDLDDSYPQLPPSNPAHRYWIANSNHTDPDPVSALREGLRHADGLISPSKTLLADWADIVPGYHVPNWTRRTWYEPLQQKPLGAPDVVFNYDAERRLIASERPDSAGTVVLGWGGSISHVDSWLYSEILPALDRLFTDRPNVRLKFCGGESRLDYVFNRWPGKVWRQSGVIAEHWPTVVGSFDIGLAPLDPRHIPPFREGGPDASYDDRRSWLKGVEYLCAGVPWVGSESHTYADLRRWGTLVPPVADEWYAALVRMVDNLQTEKAKAADRRRWAMRKVTFEANVGAYFEILARAASEKGTRQGARLPGIIYVAPQPVQETA